MIGFKLNLNSISAEEEWSALILIHVLSLLQNYLKEGGIYNYLYQSRKYNIFCYFLGT